MEDMLGSEQEKLEEGVAYREDRSCSYSFISCSTKPFNWAGKLMTFSKNLLFT